MLLNEEISLAKFNDDFIYNRKHPKDFFRCKAAKEKVLLPINTVLWKCTDFGISPSHEITEWWASGQHFEEVLRRCARLGISVQQYCRARYAVIWEWGSAMSYILEAQLMEDVYGFSGETAAVGTSYSVKGQKTPRENIALIGGDPQLCIPNLKVIRQISLKPSDSLPAGR